VYKLDNKLASHLAVKQGVYYFVRRVPSDLVRYYRSTRVSYSLRTKSQRVANARARGATHKLEEYWYHLRLRDSPIPCSYLVLDNMQRSNEELGPTLSEALELYLKLKGQGKSITFHQAATRACSYLTAICSDKRLGLYTRADANSFRDYLIRKGLSGSSITRIFNSILSVLNFSISEHALLFKNPFSGVFYDRKSGVQTRFTLPLKDLTKVKAQCQTYDDELRWAVALVADTGMRLAEAVGLAREDLCIESDIPYVIVRPHSWRRLKTAGSERTIPLVGAALWGATRVLSTSNGTKFCFPQYNKSKTTNANSASGALNKWLKNYVSNGSTMHSFRHSIRDRLRAVECPSDIIDQIGGWTTSGVGQSYGEGYPLEVCHKWMIRALG
jgi:integrase